MLLLSSSSSTFSVAFLLALLVATQVVDAREFAVKSDLGSGTEVDAESKEGAVWTDGPMSMTMSIKLREGVENIPVVGGEEKSLGPCTQFYEPDRQKAIKRCTKFVIESGYSNGDLKCNPDGNCTCCCKE